MSYLPVLNKSCSEHIDLRLNFKFLHLSCYFKNENKNKYSLLVKKFQIPNILFLVNSQSIIFCLSH